MRTKEDIIQDLKRAGVEGDVTNLLNEYVSIVDCGRNQFLNAEIMEVNQEKGKLHHKRYKPAYIKLAIPSETADKIMKEISGIGEANLFGMQLSWLDNRLDINGEKK